MLASVTATGDPQPWQMPPAVLHVLPVGHAEQAAPEVPQALLVSLA